MLAGRRQSAGTPCKTQNQGAEHVHNTAAEVTLEGSVACKMSLQRPERATCSNPNTSDTDRGMEVQT